MNTIEFKCGDSEPIAVSRDAHRAYFYTWMCGFPHEVVHRRVFF